MQAMAAARAVHLRSALRWSEQLARPLLRAIETRYLVKKVSERWSFVNACLIAAIVTSTTSVQSDCALPASTERIRRRRVSGGLSGHLHTFVRHDGTFSM